MFLAWPNMEVVMADAGMMAHDVRCLEHLKQARALGLSLAQYARAHGLKVRMLYDADNRLRKKGLIADRRSQQPGEAVAKRKPRLLRASSLRCALSAPVLRHIVPHRCFGFSTRAVICWNSTAGRRQRWWLRHCGEDAMLRPDRNIASVYMHRAPIDMRRQIDGLSVLVVGIMQHNPLPSGLFVFIKKRRNKLKILTWERNGFTVWYKRLEEEEFQWPVRSSETVVTLTASNWIG
jgi:transposase